MTTQKLFKSFYILFTATLATVLNTSCSDELLRSGGNKDEYVTVTFNLRPETAAATSRADKKTISDGSDVDMLIFAVYNSDGELLEEYSQGIDPALEAKGFNLGDGQSIKQINGFPYRLSLSLKRGEQYTIAFWAQSSETKAYNTIDLRKVEVIYGQVVDSSSIEQSGEQSGGSTSDDNDSSNDTPATTPTGTNALNNDDMRDAFCRSVQIIPNSTNGTMSQNVYLYRPLAQINVGTSGFDYEIINRASIKKYTYSKIRINRVARYLDVVLDKTYLSTTDENEDNPTKSPEAFAVVDFDYAPIPAYIDGKIPAFPSYTRYDWIYDQYFSPNDMISDDDRLIYDNEQFLHVNLYDKGEGSLSTSDGGKYMEDIDDDGYMDYANFNKYEDFSSETFKYLSMCYVLTSSTEESAVVINNVKVWLATSPTGADAVKILDIDHVPAQRNWRTNIVGNILSEKNTFQVKLDKDFAGDYYAWGEGDNWDWSGPLYEGVYYDAKKDVIEISNAVGLIWFQRMVNGSLWIRNIHAGSSNVQTGTSGQENYRTIGDNYRYYDSDGSILKLGSGTNGFNYMSTEVFTGTEEQNQLLLKRYLKATHQDQRGNDDDEWPEYNNRSKNPKKPTNSNYPTWKNQEAHYRNFHFTGATVKLVADIDLAGIEWFPIGMDNKLAEYKQFYFEDYGDEGQTNPFSDNIAENRGFYGTFDGNGHTIYNLTTKRFSARVDDYYIERNGYNGDAIRNYDALPWMARGLFGEIGGDACIKNVRLQNVDIYGCQGVGGIVGMAYGDKIRIENCVVDGGSVIATPLYRNDKPDSRTFARGTYTGGIVGYFNTRGGVITNCEVKNLTVKGYRQVGSLVGTIDRKYSETDTNGKSSQGHDAESAPEIGGISNNTVSNTIVIASQMHYPFGAAPQSTNTLETELGFGWLSTTNFDLYSGELIGGDWSTFISKTISAYTSATVLNNVTFSEITEYMTSDTTDPRQAEIRSIPLEQMPPLSSWFTDKITIRANYFGSPGNYRCYNVSKFTLHKTNTTSLANFYSWPMNLPMDVMFDWNIGTGAVGLYVESVKIDGSETIGGRSVITVDNVTNENSCCMFITARDRKNAGSIYTTYDRYARPTELSHMVIRGNPYGYHGIEIAPNENMSYVRLDNIAVYDVFKTICLSNLTENGAVWPTESSLDASNSTLYISNSNLRGYTIPGAGWKLISNKKTTFEQGTYTGNGELEYTYKVESQTEFDECYFKAPFIIDLTELPADKSVTFTNCYASSASIKNEPIDNTLAQGCKYIRITSNAQGKPQITYEK